MYTKRYTRLLSLLLALTLLAGLSTAALATEETPDPENPEGSVAVTGVSLDESSLSLSVGGRATLTATVSPYDAANQRVDWSTDDDTVASVSQNGVVTAKSAGEATITVTTRDGGFTAECDVTVTAPVAVESVDLSPRAITLSVGERATLTAEVSPDNATNQALTWRSSDPTVVTVDGGRITAKSAGEATVTVTTQDGGFSAECDVTVTGETSISLSKTSLTLERDKTWQLTANVTPADSNVTWSSDNRSVATVSSDGLVTAKGIGLAIITAKLSSGQSASCSVTVVKPAPSLSPASLDLKVGNTASVTLRDVPEGAEINWSVDRPAIAGIKSSSDSGCQLEALAAGTATLTATIRSGSSSSRLTCQVTVSSAAEPKLSSSSVSLPVGRTHTLSVSNLPTGGSVSWSSSKTSVATVSSSGVITAVAKGSATITAAVKNSSGSTVATLSCSVTVTSNTISYSVQAGKSVSFIASDFNTFCRNETGETLDYVTFSLPSSSKGTLYYKYDQTGQKTVSSSTKYYRSGSSLLSDVSFLASKSASTGTITISFSGRSTGNTSFSGTLSIDITARSTDPEVSLKTDRNTAVSFSSSDFNTVCKNETGYSLDRVRFTLPSDSKGTLYYKYDQTGQKTVSSSTSYYRSESPQLSDVSFVPAKNYTGTVTFSFTGWSSDDTRFTGTVTIQVRDTSDTGSVSYETSKNEPVSFRAADFNSACKDATDYSLDYVRFSLPSSSKGKLYYKYDESGQKTVSSSTSYYRSESPQLSDVSFVPASGFTGKVTIDFTGYNTNGKSFSGTVSIQVGDSADSGDISYTTAKNKAVSFRASDFNAFCKDQTDYSLDYVRFSLPSSSKGKLYYKYDESGQKTVSSSTSYYRSDSPSIDDVSFVPASGFTGKVTIDFTGYNTNGKSFSGTVSIQVGDSKASTISYVSDGTAVLFASRDFSAACTAAGGSTLSYVRFTLPNASLGRLYYKYTSPRSNGGRVSQSTSYYLSGTPLLSDVSFLPKAGCSGTVTIGYTAVDKNGSSYTGSVQITVTQPTRSKTFTDMNNHAWAVPSVDFLARYNVTNGLTSTTYGPSGSITRGDFVLMLYRAFGLKDSASLYSFDDVPTNSYYAKAIAAAKALGIAKGSDGQFRPSASLTRQDAMVLLSRTLEVSGSTLSSASASYLNKFTDAGQVASYAKDPVAALIQAGVIQGSNGKINPAGALTRAEMAAILHRVLTL